MIKRLMIYIKFYLVSRGVFVKAEILYYYEIQNILTKIYELL